MEVYDWLVADLLYFIYNVIVCLIYLTRNTMAKSPVTTTAGHIFELNVLLKLTVTVN